MSLYILTCNVIAGTLEIKRFTFHYCTFIILHKSMPRQMQAYKNKQIRSNYFLRKTFSLSNNNQLTKMNLHLNKQTFPQVRAFYLSYMVIK
jgi:hypothetical protein